ncbi:MAG: hypothetical protein J3K34DRAFT_404319, partial [Monoraphidium minutum]
MRGAALAAATAARTAVAAAAAAVAGCLLAGHQAHAFPRLSALLRGRCCCLARGANESWVVFSPIAALRPLRTSREAIL